MMSWDDGWWSWWMAIPLGLVMLAFWGLLAWVLLTPIRLELMREIAPPRSPDPEEWLAQRLAAGEIDTTEYEDRIEALRRVRTSIVSERSEA